MQSIEYIVNLAGCAAFLTHPGRKRKHDLSLFLMKMFLHWVVDLHTAAHCSAVCAPKKGRGGEMLLLHLWQAVVAMENQEVVMIKHLAVIFPKG